MASSPTSSEKKEEKEKDDKGEQFELPKAVLNRIVKSSIPDNILVAKEAKEAILKAAGVFILYLSACANDYCTSGAHARSTISAKDVELALEELEFNDFIVPTREALEAYKNEQKAKKLKKQSTSDAPSDTPDVNVADDE